MKQLDFAAINAALDAEALVPRWLPRGQRRHNEWVAANPTRADNSPGSFSINLKTGVWKDFAGGSDDWGKDLVSLYAYLFHSNDQGAAARELTSEHGIHLTAEARQQAVAERQEKVAQIEAAKPRLIMPVPQDAPPPTFRHRDYGDPTVTWCYRDAKGQPLMYVCRFDPPAERKQVIPRSWCEHPGKGTRWTWRGVTGKQLRPLYGLDRLAANPDVDVVLVEGEGKADAGQKIFGDTAVVVGWLGGVETADRVNVRALEGRRVILWPDFDAQRERLTKDEQAEGVDPSTKPLLPLREQPGMRAMRAHAQALKGVAREVVMVGYAVDPARAGWDLGDAKAEGWDLARVRAYMGKHAGDPAHIASGERAAQSANDSEPLPLDKPLAAPETIYHTDHIDWKRDKETGEWRFHQAKGTAENLARLVEAYDVRVRYNELSRDVEISVNGALPTGDLARNVSLSRIEDLCRINGYPYTAAAGHLDHLAARDAYNPALDWVNSRPWDGGEHIAALFACLTLADETKADISRTLFHKWFLGAVAILSGHARKFEHVLVLVDPHGGIGKTRFFNSLCPVHFQADGVTLNPDDKDSVLQVVSKWLVELGEIGATFSRSDMESLKAFLSRDVDELRPAYARAANRYQRRTAFFGSVNNVQFLVDDTNNRRFWPIEVKAIVYRHKIDAQQAWAEALARVKAGEAWHLDEAENKAIGAHNESFRSKDRVEELILSLYDPSAVRCRYVSASDVLLEIGVAHPKQTDTRKAASLLRKLFPNKLTRGVTVYHMPALEARAGRLTVVGGASYYDRPW